MTGRPGIPSTPSTRPPQGGGGVTSTTVTVDAQRIRDLERILLATAEAITTAEQHAAIYCAHCGQHTPTLAGLLEHLDDAKTGTLAAYHLEEETA